jgi:glycine betaine catabolism B
MQDYHAVVIEKILRTPGALSVRMEKPAGFSHQAGQWAVFTLPGGLTRTLSISSAPGEPFLEFTKRLSPSDFCQALHALSHGDAVEVKGPGGVFTFPDPPPADGSEPVRAAFLTGGIGITPFRSILRDQADRGLHPDRVFLFFNRVASEIPFGTELEEIARKDPTFRLVHILEEPPAGWKGYVGRITREILIKELPDIAGRTFFVCGPPPMIAAVDRLLAELSVPPARVKKESFSAPAAATRGG